MKYKQIGKALKMYREKRNWTVNDVAIKLQNDYQIDVREKTVYGWESNQSYPRTKTLLALCEMYHIDDITEGLLNNPPANDFPITTDERDLIEKYRQHPELRSVVKRVLDVPQDKE